MNIANPVELEQAALALMHQGNLLDAIKRLTLLLEGFPDWEHGMGHHLIAPCYEDTESFDLAREHYLEALKIEPKNRNWLGGYASFLYLHGDASEAFEVYLTALATEREFLHIEGEKGCLTALAVLGKKLGMSEAEVKRRVAEIEPKGEA